jgi:hypothetical protein
LLLFAKPFPLPNLADNYSTSKVNESGEKLNNNHLIKARACAGQGTADKYSNSSNRSVRLCVVAWERTGFSHAAFWETGFLFVDSKLFLLTAVPCSEPEELLDCHGE